MTPGRVVLSGPAGPAAETGVRCPSCGTPAGVGETECRVCGTLLAATPADDFQPLEDVIEDEPPESTMDGGGFEELPDEAPPGRAPPGPMSRLPPGRPAPPMSGAARPGLAAPLPAAPARPEPTPAEAVANREKFMMTGMWMVIALGVAGAVFGPAAPYAFGWIAYGTAVASIAFSILTIVLVVIVLSKAKASNRGAQDRVSEMEDGNIARVRTGAYIILFVPLLELSGIPYYVANAANLSSAGYFSPPWSWWNILLVVWGLYTMARGASALRERIGTFQVWQFGVTALILAPFPGIFAGLLGIAAPDSSQFIRYPEFFASSVGVVGFITMTMAMGINNYLRTVRTTYDTALQRGDATFRAGRYSEAIAAYDEAIDVAHGLYAHLLYDPETARSMRLPPEYVLPWLRKADTLAAARRLRKAVAILEMVLALDPQNEVVWNRKGELLVSDHRYKEALDCLRSALQLNPGYERARTNLARLEALIRQLGPDALKERGEGLGPRAG